MGKMLDSLKQVNGQRPEPKACSGMPETPAPVPSAPAATAPNVGSDAPCDIEEYPFIEVGAPGKKIEASPVVLAATPASLARHSPTAVIATAAATQPTLVPKLIEPQPLGVSFETWPAHDKPPAVAREIIAFHQPDHPVSKQYAALFATMLEGVGRGEGRVLLAIGSAPQVGTTTVLLNLAFAGCASGSRRLALVEANTRPALARRLGLGPVPGLADVLAGSAALDKTVVPTAHPQVHALSAGRKPGLCAPEALRWVLGWLRQRYDIVLVDGADVSEASALSPVVEAADAVYLVLPQDETTSSKTTTWTQTIARLGGQLRGLIHTHFENA